MADEKIHLTQKQEQIVKEINETFYLFGTPSEYRKILDGWLTSVNEDDTLQQLKEYNAKLRNVTKGIY